MFQLLFQTSVHEKVFSRPAAARRRPTIGTAGRPKVATGSNRRRPCANVSVGPLADRHRKTTTSRHCRFLADGGQPSACLKFTATDMPLLSRRPVVGLLSGLFSKEFYIYIFSIIILFSDILSLNIYAVSQSVLLFK